MRIVIVLLVLAAALGGYLYLNPGVVDQLLREAGLERDASRANFYKWRDAQGEWHFTDEPPPAGTPYETLEYREEVNILPRPDALRQD